VESLLAQEGSSSLAREGRSALQGKASLLETGTLVRAGALVGPYKLEARIGAGGMGEVFRAVDTRLQRTVAIKFLRGSEMADPAHRRRFLQEARASSALNHPNIVVIHDISGRDGIDFLVMEHVPGQTLKDLIPAEGMPFDSVAHLGSQIASALAAAHAAGIVHRDIKPANIMVTPDQQVKVLDFGIAKVTPQVAGDPDGETRTLVEGTTPGMVMGTISYMSPEQTRGEPVDGRADIFSLGCVLYQAATGRLPFGGASALAVMHEIATANPVAPSHLRAELPQGFDRLVAACLEKNRAQRPASAAEVARELKALASSANPVPVRRSAGRRSVAVIPFRFRNAPPEGQFLSLALAEAVVNRLASSGDLLVRPTASVLRYAGTDVEWTQVARELNVDLVVGGTIQQSGARVRVLVQALQASDSRTLHSSQHDGDAGDLFGLQDRIADSVSDAFSPRKKRSALPAVPPTRNPLAYEIYMRAVDRLVQWNRFDMGSAIEMLNRVVELDPDFAGAWGQLAQAYSQMGIFDGGSKWSELAEHAIAKTLELDPIQCDALQARAQTLWSASRRFQSRPALRALNAALRVNPSRYTARWCRGAIFFHLGFYEEAEHDLQETLLANPNFAMALVARAMIAQYEGDFGAAHELNERALVVDPTFNHAYAWSPLAPLLMGRTGEARERIRRARQIVPEESLLTAIEGLAAAQEGSFQRAEQLADSSLQTGKSVTHAHHTWHCAAGVYALCGQRDKAILQLRRCAEMGLPNHLLFGNDQNLRPLRDLPEFRALLSGLRREYDQYRVEIDSAERTQAE
jgi:serine/threonine protein kinase/tetratricopeptide (TPR) repeat protein